MDEDKVVNRVLKRLEEVDAESAKLDAEREDLHTFLRIQEQYSEPEEDVSSADDGPVYPGIVIDFAGANNLGERLARIGRSVEGTLEVKDMAACLIERGESNASLINLRAAIINQLRDDPDFEKVGRSQYCYSPQTGDLVREMT